MEDEQTSELKTMMDDLQKMLGPNQPFCIGAENKRLLYRKENKLYDLEEAMKLNATPDNETHQSMLALVNDINEQLKDYLPSIERIPKDKLRTVH